MSKLVVVSGGFDPIHRGHVNLIAEAASMGRVVVIVESDQYVSSKHPVMVQQKDRIEILRSLKNVSMVLGNFEPSGDCSSILKSLRPDVFMVGPDHKNTDGLVESKMCMELGIEIRCATGLIKDSTSSSSMIVEAIRHPISSQWDSFNSPVTASVIPLNGDSKVLMGVRNTDPGTGRYELIGGFVERGETLEQAAYRECVEESRTNPYDLRYVTSVVVTYFDGRKVLSTYFTCRIDQDPQRTEEIRGFEWVERCPDEILFPEERAVLSLVFNS